MSKHDPSSELPSLIQDVNACISDALDHLVAGRVSEAISVLKAIADPVREMIGDLEEFEKES